MQGRLPFLRKHMTKDEIMAAFAANRLDEARAALEALAEGPERAWALLMLGRIAWKEGRHSEAMGLYAESARLDPAVGAETALEQARQIMAFYHRDLYNP